MSSPRVRYDYHRNTGIVNCRVNSSAKLERQFSSYASTSSSSDGILSESVASQVFAHEVGHSFGAKHDDLDEACNPLRKDNFIMTGSARVIIIIKHNIIPEVKMKIFEFKTKYDDFLKSNKTFSENTVRADNFSTF